MTEEKSGAKLILYGLILLILFLGLIRIFINGYGNFFNLELIGLLFLTGLSLVGLANYNQRRGEDILFFVFVLYIANLLLLWIFKGNLYFILLVISLVGGTLSLPGKSFAGDYNDGHKHSEHCNHGHDKEHYKHHKHHSHKESEVKVMEKHNMVFEDDKEVVPTSTLMAASSMEMSSTVIAEEPVKKTVKTSAKSSSKSAKKSTKTAKHSPGKYVASSSSNQYHEPKCEWAKRIKKQRRVWFAKKEEAWEKGYKKHSCVN